MTDIQKTQEVMSDWMLHLKREFAHPIEKVFSAWTKPEALKGWFCNTGVAEFNPVEGGEFYVELMSEQFGLLKLTGRYLEVVSNQRIKFTWKWLSEPFTEVGETVVTVEFIEKESSTELKLTHEGFPTEDFRNNHTEGWAWAMENFGKSLQISWGSYMLKIYGSEISNNVNKVRFIANALGLEYELVHVDLLHGEQRGQEFLELNPVGKVPVVDDDGFILFESSAISKYLADKHGSLYYPKDLRKRALVDQWVDFCNIHVHTALTRVFFNKVIAPSQGFDVDERSGEFGQKMLGSYLPVLDTELGKNEYLAGNEITIADLNLLSVLEPAEVSGVELSKHENLHKYITGLRKQDFYTKCHSDYSQVLAKLMG